jgi:hypothetical protein
MPKLKGSSRHRFLECVTNVCIMFGSCSSPLRDRYFCFCQGKDVSWKHMDKN